MPTIEVELEDLESLLGMKLPRDKDELIEILAFVKGEAKNIEAGIINIELKDSNRADIWSVEGLARALRGFLGIEPGLKDYYLAGCSGVEISVDSRLKNIRPYIACSVIKGAELTDVAIRQIMHFQDKMDQTYGRNRQRTSIGLYDYDLIAPPLHYGVSKPKEVSFIPLEFNEKLTLEEILEKHPKGIEYGHIVRHHPAWPILLDSEGKVLSFPPIINSNDLGRVTENTENVLIEVTGTVYETVQNTLINVTLALADRGGNIYSTRIHYPYKDIKSVETPDLKVWELKVDVEYIYKIIGVKLSLPKIKSLLRKACYGYDKTTKSEITVKVPCYRVDILHPIDIVEDIAISYDYNRFQPRWPQLMTIGGLSSEAKFRNVIREAMVGLGFQEVLTYSMTSPDALFTRMCLEPERVVEISNPKLTFMTCLRNWLLPSLFEFLSHNIHVEYPQKIFEVGYCTIHDERQENKTRDLEKLAGVTIHSEASFTEAKSMLDAILSNIGVHFRLEPMDHGSFIEGRAGRIFMESKEIGLMGELHPQALQNWNLENPAAAFELDISKLYNDIKTRI